MHKHDFITALYQESKPYINDEFNHMVINNVYMYVYVYVYMYVCMYVCMQEAITYTHTSRDRIYIYIKRI